ncbi:50S ribosomal protein L13 [Candidatus Woesearchaeota archaeon CG11_big_fil_rev_8_21_14_0_20_43_8]|nr:MAG: 50S ribosomal protein L13 [Candidatus Woesearchaeota archaeon CG11_big_fil_rev_8_21_14_0_20_43_8]PIO06701.1 MAG: 50S ribosomal protein L13 [Candidatus Woesearchaeota archaeon CG08_land_8_20_14_0_20_43_7]
MIIDATNMVLGRLATKAAKMALLGERVNVINCEKAIITGPKKVTIGRYLQRRDRGEPTHGPFISRLPDRIVRRTIRGMLPYKRERGQSAFKRVMCYIGVPEKLKDQKAETVDGADMAKLPTLKYVTILELSRQLGAKI